MRDGQAMTSDGPFAEVKEHLAGFYLIDVRQPGTGGGDRRADPGGRDGAWSRCGRCSTWRRARTCDTGVEGLLRELAPQVLGALVRRYGDFDTCEDAVQEALLAAATQWPAEGCPDNPKGWLITVASRRRIEMWRSESARRRREETAVRAGPARPGPGAGRSTTR